MSRRNPSRRGSDFGRFSDTWLRDVKGWKNHPASHTPPGTLPPQKQEALWPRNAAKTPPSLSNRSDIHPRKRLLRRLPTTPQAASSTTYAARTRLRNRASRAPAGTSKRRGTVRRQGRARPSILRLRDPGRPRPEAWFGRRVPQTLPSFRENRGDSEREHLCPAPRLWHMSASSG